MPLCVAIFTIAAVRSQEFTVTWAARQYGVPYSIYYDHKLELVEPSMWISGQLLEMCFFIPFIPFIAFISNGLFIKASNLMTQVE